jgi:hypothetical protein
MRVPPPFRAQLSVVLLGALTILTGCYRPNIADGGFKCAAGGVCPDGFHCVSSNNGCYEGDAGPAAPTCNIPTPTASCTIAPATGQSCTPACQFGCECGRCNVVNGVATCNQTGGSKDIDDICNLTSDDCKAGLYCQPACNSPGFGRCYKFCSTGTDCWNGVCSAAARDMNMQPTAFKVCDISPQNCDPIGNSGCPSTVLACYDSFFGKPYCDCQGTGAVGADCLTNSDCTPGETCLSVGGGTKCVQLCPSSANTCTSPATCNDVDGTYGYCSTT